MPGAEICVVISDNLLARHHGEAEEESGGLRTGIDVPSPRFGQQEEDVKM